MKRLKELQIIYLKTKRARHEPFASRPLAQKKMVKFLGLAQSY